MDLSSALAAFFEEARDQCQVLEDALLDAEQSPPDAETFNRMFRAAHTIKGSAGLFALDATVRFTHHVENVLDRLRDSEINLSLDLVTLLLACNDHIGRLLQEATDPAQATQDLPEGAALVERLQAFSQAAPPARPSEPTGGEALSSSTSMADVGSGHDSVANSAWHISIRFAADVLQNGMDPGSFLRYLKTLGRLRQVVPMLQEFPAAASFDPELCYLGLEIDLETQADRETIEGTFEFVRDDSTLFVLSPRAAIEDYARLLDQLPETDQQLLDCWLAMGTLSADECHLLQPVQAVFEAEHAPPALSGAAPLASPEDKHKAGKRSASEGVYIRVEANKLDTLINKVGELVIAAAATNMLAELRHDAELSEMVTGINTLVGDIRDGALKMRMVPIGEVFNRFPRVVRDTAQALGKLIALDIEGAETEIDKSMIDKIADPLMHLVRNSLDHGIEAPAVRGQRGKPETGTVSLTAYHDSGSVVIEIGDDGGGINRQKVLERAVQRGIVRPDQELSAREIHMLIFEPGFSTAETVTNLSGRGVGMDVVRRNIEALRGSVEIDSEQGVGTVITLRLPLTLAIIDGFRVAVGDSSLVVPLEMVIECVDMPRDETAGGARQINVRGEWIPYVSLRELFQIPGADPDLQYVVVVQWGHERAGLVVDCLYGELQVVVKPLGMLFRAIRGLSGSTILGNGDLALILDVPQLIQVAGQKERHLLGQQVSARGGFAPTPVHPAAVLNQNPERLQ